MKQVKSLFIACIYPVIYLICQIIAQVLMLESDMDGKMYITIIIASTLCFSFFYLINIVRKDKMFSHYKKITLQEGIIYIMKAIGLYFLIVIFNSLVIQFFPTYDDEIMGLFQMEDALLAIFVIAVVAPFIEELIFRGEVYKELEKNFTTASAIIIQAILFAIIHPIPLQKIQTFMMALVLGYIRSKTKNIWGPTIMHITSNMVACLLVLILL